MQSFQERAQYAIERGMNKHGCSEAALAKKIGIAPPSLHAWKSGETKSLKADVALQAAKLMGVHVRWLVLGEGLRDDDEQQQPESIQDSAPPIELTAEEQDLLAFFRELDPKARMSYLQRMLADVTAAQAKRILEEKYGANGVAPDSKVEQAYGTPLNPKRVIKKTRL